MSLTCEISLPAGELTALWALYNATDGPNWRYNVTAPQSTHWSFPCDPWTPCQDHWEGLTCAFASASECTVSELNLQYCNLAGALPSSLVNLTSLEVLDLSLNHITGELPSEIGELRHLFRLSIGGNLITSSIPSELGKAKSLLSIDFASNYLDGWFPETFSSLSAVLTLDLSINLLSGPITNSSVMKSIAILLLDENLFSGSIPQSVDEMFPSIEVLWLFKNNFTHTLPNTVGNLHKLYELYLYNNSFTGTLPTEIGQLSSTLESLAIEFNYFSGSVPTELGLLTTLSSVGLFSNQFSGTIPTELGQLSNISFIALFENMLTGLLPTQLEHLAICEGFAFNTNMLSGPLSLPSSSKLRFIYMYDNYFTGQLPELLFSRTTLTQILLQQNYMSGSIDNRISDLKSLNDFSIGFNFFSGSLSNGIPNLSNLTLFDVSNNFFQGELAKVLLPSNSKILNLIDVSQNGFTGTIPDYIFTSKLLQSVSLYSNCFHGSIPQTICSSPLIDVLVLDGLSSAQACEQHIPGMFRWLIKVNFPKYTMTGSIPSCVWQSPTLRLFHASGNGLSGTLQPFADTSKSKLSDINVENNNLIGTIPISLQTNSNIKQIGLANNRLTGTLTSDIVVASSVDLTVNRLSGNIPSTLLAASASASSTPNSEGILLTTNILSGNLFQCEYNSIHNSADPDRETYICGSSNFDSSVITFACALIFAALTALGIHLWTRRQSTEAGVWDGSKSVTSATTKEERVDDVSNEDEVHKESLMVFNRSSLFFTEGLSINWESIIKEMQLQVTAPITLPTPALDFLGLLSEASIAACVVCLFDIVVCLCSYVTIKVFSKGDTFGHFSTHYFQYAWVASCAFLHGYVPTLVVCCFVLISLMICRWMVTAFTQGNSQRPVSAIDANATTHATQTDQTAHGERHRRRVPSEIQLSVITPSQALQNAQREHREHIPPGEVGNPLQAVEVDVESTCKQNDGTGDQQNVRVVNSLTSIAEYFSQRIHLFSGFALLLGMHCLNMLVTLIINFLYVYGIFEGVGKDELLALQLFVSIVKLLWTRLAIPRMVQHFPNLPPVQKNIHLLTLNIFLYLIGPILATYIGDSSCLYYVFAGLQPIQAPYSYLMPERPVCINVDGHAECVLLPQLQQTTSIYTPPFIYSYQCSSSLLTSYVPVFIYSYAISGVIIPCIVYAFLILDSSSLTSNIPSTRRIPNSSTWANSISCRIYNFVDKLVDNTVYRPRTLEVMDMSDVGAASSEERIDSRNRIFNGAAVEIRMMIDFALLLSFGIAAPILGIAIVIEMVVTALMWRFFINRFSHLSYGGYLRWLKTSVLPQQDKEASRQMLLRLVQSQLEAATAYAGRAASSSMQVVVFSLGLFWGLLALDMIGDVYGSQEGILAFFAVWISIPICFNAVDIWPCVYPIIKCFGQQESATQPEANRNKDQIFVICSNEPFTTPS